MSKYYGYVYLSRDLTNGKFYIGQRGGMFDPTYFGSGKYLVNAINSHGRKNFTVEVVAWCETKELTDWTEEFFIDIYDAVDSPMFYNLAKGGRGLRRGSKRDPAAVEKTAAWHRGKARAPTVLQGILRGNALRAAGLKPPRQKLSPESIEKIVSQNTGRKRSQETIEKVRAAHLGKRRKPEACARMKEAWVIRRANMALLKSAS